jgi:hypothetical protein
LRTKNLTRAQRKLLEENGYKGDLSGWGYLKEDKDYIYFLNPDKSLFLYDKKKKVVCN